MTDQGPYLPPPAPPRSVGVDPERLRDVAAVVLILVGLAGLLTAAFTFDPLAGLAVLSIVTITAGVVLGLRW